MSNRQKKALFCVCGALSFACVLGAAVAVGSPQWVKGSILCHTGAELVNATDSELEQFVGRVAYGLFHGQRLRQCGLGGRPLRFSFFPDLMGVIPMGLHVSVLLFCALLVVFSSVTSAFCLYNAFGSPYETLHGPLGLYLWNLISCETRVPEGDAYPEFCAAGLCGSLAMILFASEVKVHRLSEKIANFNERSFVYKTQAEQFDRSFWIILFVFLTHAVNILLVRLAGIQFPFQEAKEPELSTGASDLMY
ncbi:clarin-1 isoform X1 [Scleropages formosus]|uniref:clarin-1 isoform X1 n=1 Tax=Scleropages formosus TaxID=113540 RepID=UPI0008788137|nr:clarin-1 isoform X1 [Scleropages formosus]